MARNSSRYIKVDELVPQVSLEQAAAYYGVTLPELHRVGNEVRAQCFANCGKTEETGGRAVSIQLDHPSKIWRCHQYGCGKGGNLISLCDLLKPGANHGGKPRGDRFKEIAEDLQAMSRGENCPTAGRQQGTPSRATSEPMEEQKENRPLKDNEEERIRALVSLDGNLRTDVAQMTPKAAGYFRQRPYLTPEVCEKWRMGFLPRDAEDKRGGTLRGKIVYSLPDKNGDVLVWFGRDPEFEEKHARWIGNNREGREPVKFQFVKGFHRGQELYGQHRFGDADVREKTQESGLVVVEGPNDVIRLDTLGVPSVGLLSNTITKRQVQKIGELAHEYAAGRVVLMFDTDVEGDRGAKQALWELAHSTSVRLGWSRQQANGAFADRQPESLDEAEWQALFRSWK